MTHVKREKYLLHDYYIPEDFIKEKVLQAAQTPGWYKLL